MGSLWFIYGVCVFLTIVFNCTAFKQDDYTIKLLIFHFTNVNRSYSINAKCDLHWFNRTTRVINCNILLLKDLNSNVKISTQIYKFSSNEYRLFPLQMTVDLCHELNVDQFGIVASLRNSINCHLQCPFKKGWVNITNGMIDFTKFPPHMPHGQYMDQIIIRDNNNFVAELQVEGIVEDIIKKWKN